MNKIEQNYSIEYQFPVKALKITMSKIVELMVNLKSLASIKDSLFIPFLPYRAKAVSRPNVKCSIENSLYFQIDFVRL